MKSYSGVSRYLAAILCLTIPAQTMASVQSPSQKVCRISNSQFADQALAAHFLSERLPLTKSVITLKHNLVAVLEYILIPKNGARGLLPEWRTERGSLHIGRSSDNISLRYERGFKFNAYGREYVHDSYAIYSNGEFVDEALLKLYTVNDLIRTILVVSQQIQSSPDIRAFEEGRLEVEKADGNATILVRQVWELFDALSARVEASEKYDATSLLDYLYNTSNVKKPFSELVAKFFFDFLLHKKREDLYQLLDGRRQSLSKAMALMRAYPYNELIELDHIPSTIELRNYFDQSSSEIERHIVVDGHGKTFLVGGGSPTEGIKAYRLFPNLIADIHTHYLDYSFSVADLALVTSGSAKDIYGGTGHFRFFVRAPTGIFEFFHKGMGRIETPHIADEDYLAIPCTVTFLTRDGRKVEQHFDDYSNHERGVTGRYITAAITSGAQELTVTFTGGDEIRFFPWDSFKTKTNFLMDMDALLPPDARRSVHPITQIRPPHSPADRAISEFSQFTILVQNGVLPMPIGQFKTAKRLAEENKYGAGFVILYEEWAKRVYAALSLIGKPFPGYFKFRDDVLREAPQILSQAHGFESKTSHAEADTPLLTGRAAQEVSQNLSDTIREIEDLLTGLFRDPNIFNAHRNRLNEFSTRILSLRQLLERREGAAQLDDELGSLQKEIQTFIKTNQLTLSATLERSLTPAIIEPPEQKEVGFSKQVRPTPPVFDLRQDEQAIAQLAYDVLGGVITREQLALDLLQPSEDGRPKTAAWQKIFIEVGAATGLRYAVGLSKHLLNLKEFIEKLVKVNVRVRERFPNVYFGSDPRYWAALLSVLWDDSNKNQFPAKDPNEVLYGYLIDALAGKTSPLDLDPKKWQSASVESAVASHSWAKAVQDPRNGKLLDETIVLYEQKMLEFAPKIIGNDPSMLFGRIVASLVQRDVEPRWQGATNRPIISGLHWVGALVLTGFIAHIFGAVIAVILPGAISIFYAVKFVRGFSVNYFDRRKGLWRSLIDASFTTVDYRNAPESIPLSIRYEEKFQSWAEDLALRFYLRGDPTSRGIAHIIEFLGTGTISDLVIVPLAELSLIFQRHVLSPIAKKSTDFDIIRQFLSAA